MADQFSIPCGGVVDLKIQYRAMLRIRMIEEAIAIRYKEQQMRCPVHLSIGQEAAAVGVAENLRAEDQVVSTHRGHAHYLAKGGSLHGLLCELYGKVEGCGRGQGGSMHLVDRSVGFAGSTSIVGGTIPVGVGLAFAKKFRRLPGIVAVCIGDAAVEEGVFHESANFASLHNLPVVFVLENNLYSCYTHLKHRQPPRDFGAIAICHNLLFVESNGNRIDEVVESSKKAVAAARGFTPSMLVLNTYRHLEHCGPNNDDHLGYRHTDEIKFWLKNDPVLLALNKLEMASERDWAKEVEKEIGREIMAAFDSATKAPFPDQTELGKFEYAHHYSG